MVSEKIGQSGILTEYILHIDDEKSCLYKRMMFDILLYGIVYSVFAFGLQCIENNPLRPDGRRGSRLQIKNRFAVHKRK